MTGTSTIRAKQKRAGSLGQTSRLYTLKTKTGNIKQPGAQGFCVSNPSIGGMLSLGMSKQKRVKQQSN